MGNKSLRKNMILNGLQQIVTLVLPLITVPYLTRVIGKEGTGAYAYTSSIIQYFILFGTLGLSLYGTREIAYVRRNKEKRDHTFWTIQILRMTTCGIALVAYIGFMLINKSDLKAYMAIQTIALLANLIDISWFYQGIEDFSKIVYRSIVCRVIGTVCIFIFVRSSNDVWIYILIQVLVLFFGNAALWLAARNIINIYRVEIKDIISIIRPAMALFIPQVAIELYAVFDKTMLGALATVGDVGLYAKAEEFVKIPLMLISVVSTVLYPRMSNLFAENGSVALDKSLNNNIKLISFIGVGASFGILGIASKFVPWMMGESFLGSIRLMQLMAPLSFFIGMSNMIGRQYLLPSNQSRAFTATVSLGAIINFLLNLILIRSFSGIGACIATLIAEFSVTVSQFIIVRKHIKLAPYFSDLFKCFVSGIVMYFVVKFIGAMVSIPVLNTVTQIVAGGIIYVAVLVLMKNDYAKLVIMEITRMWK